MATKKTGEKRARYLQKDGRVQLFAAEGIEDARIDGWEEPTMTRGNGRPYNEDLAEDEGEPASESAIGVQQAREEFDSKREARIARESAEAAEQAKAADTGQPKPDLRVQVVDSPKPQGTGTAKKSAK